MRTGLKKPLSVGTGVFAFALFLTACSPEAEESADSETLEAAVSGEVNEELPPSVEETGVIVWGTEPYYPPFQMAGDEDGEVIGLDIDLIEEITARLGLEYEILLGTFDGFIPGIKANRYDIVIDAMADTEERRKEVNFIDYFQAGSAIFAAPENASDITEMDQLCGKSVAALKATFQVEDAEAQSEKCESDGEGPIDIQVYPEQGAVNLAVTSGRADAMLMDSAMGQYVAKEAGDQFVITSEPTDPKRKGIIVAKENVGLMLAVQEALQEMIDDGTYQEIFERWDQAAGVIPEATINDGNGY